MKRTTKHVFAVIRFDAFLVKLEPIHKCFFVTEIVMSKEDAESEVQRLAMINRNKRCYYFWQMTRLVGN